MSQSGAEFFNFGTVDIATIFQDDATFTNVGTIDVAATQTLTISQIGTMSTFTNSGTITINAGALLDVNGGDFINTAGGLITGPGTFDSSGTSLTNDGTIDAGSSPGILTIDGDLGQGDGAILNVELAGSQAGAEYDQLIVTGEIE